MALSGVAATYTSSLPLASSVALASKAAMFFLLEEKEQLPFTGIIFLSGRDRVTNGIMTDVIMNTWLIEEIG